MVCSCKWLNPTVTTILIEDVFYTCFLKPIWRLMGYSAAIICSAFTELSFWLNCSSVMTQKLRIIACQTLSYGSILQDVVQFEILGLAYKQASFPIMEQNGYFVAYDFSWTASKFTGALILQVALQLKPQACMRLPPSCSLCPATQESSLDTFWAFLTTPAQIYQCWFLFKSIRINAVKKVL